MSHKATSWAFEQRGLSPSQKIVLWALADCHNPARGCFPSQEYLCEITELSERTVRECILHLESVGILSRQIMRDERGSVAGTRYYLAFEDLPANSAASIPTGKNPSPYRQNNVSLPANSAGIYKEGTCKEPVIEPVNIYIGHFADFWAQYPRKVARPKAEKAYMKAVKKATPDEILSGLMVWKMYWDDPQFIPHSATWLNDERWNDKPPERRNERGNAGQQSAGRSTDYIRIALGNFTQGHSNTTGEYGH